MDMYEDLLLPPKPLHVSSQVIYPEDDNQDQCSKEMIEIMKELVDGNLNHEITFKPMVGGVTNTLFKSTFKNEKGNHKNVIIRLYGKGSENLIDRNTESQIQYLLSKNGVGPKFYGTFDNGCIYGYIEGDQLQLEDLENTEMLQLIAKEIKRWHSLDLDLGESCREEPSSIRYLKNWIQGSLSEVGRMKTLGLDLSYYIEQSEWLIEYLTTRYSDSKHITFCHNDLIPRNMIYNREKHQTRFIDFEYSGYNYRGYDIGNFFCEFSGLDLDYTKYPSEAVQKQFISFYLSASSSLSSSTEIPKPEEQSQHPQQSSDNEIHQLYIEANQFTLVSHLMWGFWGIIQSVNSSIDFDYIDYSKKRFKQYDRVKNKVLSLK